MTLKRMHSFLEPVYGWGLGTGVVLVRMYVSLMCSISSRQVVFGMSCMREVTSLCNTGLHPFFTLSPRVPPSSPLFIPSLPLLPLLPLPLSCTPLSPPLCTPLHPLCTSAAPSAPPWHSAWQRRRGCRLAHWWHAGGDGTAAAVCGGGWAAWAWARGACDAGWHARGARGLGKSHA